MAFLKEIPRLFGTGEFVLSSAEERTWFISHERKFRETHWAAFLWRIIMKDKQHHNDLIWSWRTKEQSDERRSEDWNGLRSSKPSEKRSFFKYSRIACKSTRSLINIGAVSKPLRRAVLSPKNFLFRQFMQRNFCCLQQSQESRKWVESQTELRRFLT